jgi:hypothetical protein
MASLLPYLQRLEIKGVEESDTPTTVNNYVTITEIVEVVDQDGNPWEPVPGPDPWDELAIAENGGANLVGTNVYEIGQVVTGKTAVFIGGNPETTTYRSRWQSRVNSQESWVNSNWLNTTNEKTDHDYTILNPGQIRFQSQGRDTSVDPVLQVNSFTSVKDIPYNEFGDVSVTVNGIAYDYNTAAALTILINDPIPVVVSHTGTATPTYSWTARGDYPLVVGSQAATTDLTFPTSGAATVTCTLRDNNTQEVSTSIIINFFAVDALD